MRKQQKANAGVGTESSTAWVFQCHGGSATGSPHWKELFSSCTLSIPTSPSTLALPLAAVRYLAQGLIPCGANTQGGPGWGSSESAHPAATPVCQKKEGTGLCGVTLECWSLEMVVQAEQRNSPDWSVWDRLTPVDRNRINPSQASVDFG